MINKEELFDKRINIKDLLKIRGASFFLFVLIALFYSYPLFAQTDKNTQEKAFFLNEETQNKIDLYEDLIDKEFRQEYYDNLLSLYYQTNQDSKAEKLIKKTIKKFPQNSLFIADLGTHYIKLGEQNKANNQFDKSIENLQANSNSIVQLASYFNVRGNIDYAIKTFKKGRELFNNKSLFIYDISYLYQRQGNYEEIANEYLSLLDENPSMLNQVKIYLGSILQQDNDGKFSDFLRNTMLKKVQQEPSNQNLSQLYIWTLLQQKNYKMALTQAKAIDKRFENLTGQTVYEIANIALNNQDYEIAKEGFIYLINKGNESTYYLVSRLGLLSSLYHPFINKINHTPKEIAYLQTQYEITLEELGKLPATIPIMQQYAYLLAYYLDLPQEAVDILDQTLSMPQIKPLEKAKSKLTRADIYLMENDIWEASLTYSQVEKEFKNDVVGSEAKFKNAMLSYYNGDFTWAASQFDVLRSSTTKLIANDAMQYSILISDNIDEDSTYGGLAYFSKAEFAIFQNKYDLATHYLDTLNQQYLSHPLFDEVLYKRAEIEIHKKNYEKADSLLNLILLKYQYDIMADDALYLLAELCLTNLNSTQRAIEYYERIIIDYPNSLYVTQARKRYNELTNKDSQSPSPKFSNDFVN
ncbi:MAG: tetratricopeptide repeat protein [Bacteroidales bacterium]|nr:tetratricopeptide repeat protein [Bacteroidales bacterium]